MNFCNFKIKMPTSHHRKKHKEHLRQFRHTSDVSTTPRKARGNSVAIFTFIGAAFGLAVGYFGGLSVYLIIAAIFIGGIAGYFIGKKIDSGK